MHQTTSQERQFAWAGHAETTKGKQVLCRKTHTTLSTNRVFSDPIQSDFALHAWIQWILLSKFAFVCSEKVWSLKVFARLFEAGGSGEKGGHWHLVVRKQKWIYPVTDSIESCIWSRVQYCSVSVGRPPLPPPQCLNVASKLFSPSSHCIFHQ